MTALLFCILLLLAALVIVVSRRPSDFRITRTMLVSAPAAKVFAKVNDFHNWSAWSPWAGLDPNVKNTFEGPTSGKGAIFRWEGNNQVGAGCQTITDSKANEYIFIKLEFLKPFQATHTAEFTFTPRENQTLVSWSMYGENNFMSKAMGLFMNCDKMIGGQFDKGLKQLKAVVET